MFMRLGIAFFLLLLGSLIFLMFLTSLEYGKVYIHFTQNNMCMFSAALTEHKCMTKLLISGGPVLLKLMENIVCFEIHSIQLFP